MGKPSSPTYKIVRRNGGGCAVRIDTPNEKPVIVSGFQTDREAQAWIDRPGFSPRQSPDGTSRQKSIRSLLWPTITFVMHAFTAVVVGVIISPAEVQSGLPFRLQQTDVPD